MPNKVRQRWQRPFQWPPSTWEFTAGMQAASEVGLGLLLMLMIFTVGSAAILWPVLLVKTFQHVLNGSADDVRNSLLAVAALIGVPFLIWRTLIASKQTNISREGHYTALFTKAVEQLGADKVVKKRDFKPHYERDPDGNILKDPKGNAIQKLSETGEASGEYVTYEVTTTNYEVRLGAIYALERIAQDSSRDAWPIYLTLCSYVQNNAELRRAGSDDLNMAGRNNSDLEEIFNVLGRYKGERDGVVVTHFEGIHLPDLRFQSGELRQTAFSKCSTNSIAIRSRAEAIVFKDCLSTVFDAHQAVLRGVGLVDGSYKKIFVNDCSCEDLQMYTRSDRVMLLSSVFTQGRIRLDTRKFIISQSNFQDVEFDAEGAYDPQPWGLVSGVFRYCTFTEINFTGSDFEEVEFHSCRFVRCNFVRSRALKRDGNEFVDCFSDQDYVPGAQSTQFPDLDLQFQWSAWRRKHTYDE